MFRPDRAFSTEAKQPIFQLGYVPPSYGTFTSERAQSLKSLIVSNCQYLKTSFCISQPSFGHAERPGSVEPVRMGAKVSEGFLQRKGLEKGTAGPCQTGIESSNVVSCLSTAKCSQGLDKGCTIQN